MMTIAYTAYGRPHYFRQSVASLRGVDGIGDCRVVVHVDRHPDPSIVEENRSIARSIDFAEVDLVVNPARVEFERNVLAALDHAFEGSDFAIQLDEDILLARDALDYFSWAASEYHSDLSVHCVTGYNRRPEPAPPGEHHAVGRRSWCHAWGLGLWRRSLAHLRASGRSGGFDGRQTEMLLEEGRFEVYPLLSRAQNIGLVSSQQFAPEFTPAWFAANHLLAHWAGNHDVGEGAWREPGRPLYGRSQSLHAPTA